jgi:hypothetical protein
MPPGPITSSNYFVASPPLGAAAAKNPTLSTAA